MKKHLKSLNNFFPVRLIVDQIRLNIALVGLWLLLWAIIFGGVGRVYGIHYLFLDPEYQHSVGFFSFFWVGLAMGNFIMAFHITSYILMGHRYPFIAILDKPFAKFSINNFLFPVVTIILYTVKIIWFHWSNETSEKSDILIYILGLFTGLFLMIILVLTYLRFTNNDIFKYLAGSVDHHLRRNRLSRERIMQRYRESRSKEPKVTRYLDARFRFRDCSNLHSFPDRLSILRVFDQNHFNSVLFEFLVIVVLMMLGLLVERQWAQIPASASVLLLFSMGAMLIGAVNYWFRGWGVPILILLFIGFNLISRSGLFSGNHAAVGLDYTVPPALYTIESINKASDLKAYREDSAYLIQSLNHWKSGFPDSIKPKLPILCVSGGGQRAALWTVAAMQALAKSMGENYLNRAFAITGASGGMIGAAYYRELYLNNKLQNDPIASDEAVLKNIGKDNLNALVFSLISNDIFLDLRKTKYRDKQYYIDRGILFEYNLNRNLDNIFFRALSEYRKWEYEAYIPMMIMSPVISNDGRRLYLSSSPIAYMTRSRIPGQEKRSVRGVDFQRMFKNQLSDSLTILSALRMSASFPYITPSIQLPSQPRIEVMDAGIADNFGISDALQLTHIARDWINENTSGVVLLSIRDTKKITPIEPKAHPSLIHRFTYPISSVYNNLSNIQDAKNDQMIEYARSWLNVPLYDVAIEYDTYDFAMIQEKQIIEQNQLSNKEVARASLSWHLTSQEKKNILDYIRAPHNQKSLQLLKDIHH